MKLQPFQLERYFAKYEFSARYMLSASDCEPLFLSDLLAMADPESVHMWHELKLGYTESQGHPILRKEIAKLYQTITPEEILVVAPEQGIFVVLGTLLEKNDHAVVIFPCYQSLYEIAKFVGCEVSLWNIQDNQGWCFDVNHLSQLIKNNTKFLVINFPHNPTGSTISEHDLLKIVNLAKEKNIAIFSDEMYRFLEYEPSHRLPSVSDLYSNAISLFGMSKSFGLAGLRIGWLTTKNLDWLRKITIYKDYTTICANAPSEILAIMALRAKDKILQRNLSIIRTNLELLDDFFSTYSNFFIWNKPKASTIGFPKLKSKISAADFCRDLVEKKGVLLLPGEVYNYEGNYFRIGFGRSNMPQALEKFKEYMKNYLA